MTDTTEMKQRWEAFKGEALAKGWPADQCEALSTLLELSSIFVLSSEMVSGSNAEAIVTDAMLRCVGSRSTTCCSTPRLPMRPGQQACATVSRLNWLAANLEKRDTRRRRWRSHHQHRRQAIRRLQREDRAATVN
jgi:hypothetical protein